VFAATAGRAPALVIVRPESNERVIALKRCILMLVVILNKYSDKDILAVKMIGKIESKYISNCKSKPAL
jgi:multisubunit Na+/H+ antiporter MnhF subunit